MLNKKLLTLVPLAYLLAIKPRFPRKKATSEFKEWHYAHRGLHDNYGKCPENSLPAFSKAVTAGYGIELDIQLTKDKKVVVFHDDTLKRICHIDGFVSDYTYAELRKFNLLDTNEKIPLLTEVLRTVSGKVPLIIEIKLKDCNTLTCELANQILKNYRGLYCMESFNPMAVAWYRLHRNDIVRGQLSCNLTKGKGNKKFLNYLAKYLLFNILARPDFIAYNYKDTKNPSYLIAKYVFHAMTFAWTVDTKHDFIKNRNKFDAIIFERFIP